MTSKYRWFVIFFTVVLVSGALAGAEKTEHVWKDGKWVIAPRPVEGTPEGELALVRMYMDKDRPKDALKAIKNFMARYPNDSRREEIMILAGQAEMDRGRYEKAYDRFNEQMDQYRNGEFYDRAVQRQYEIADAFLKGRKRRVWRIFRVSAVDKGIEILNAIADRVAGTVIAEKALLRVGDYHYDTGNVVEAVDAYDHYVKTFPQSPRQRLGHAMLRAARARYAQYRGEAFDDTPLTDAQQRFIIYTDRYPEQADKANIPMVLSQIRNALVRRYFASAKFYQRVGRKTAAVFYYKKVVAQSAESHWARRAEDALGALGARPEVRGNSGEKPRPRTQPRSDTVEKSTGRTDADSKPPKNGKVEK
ncbi:MAG: outer membrane protein assembly factor BamD [Phycisphaerae bacterium]|nr:outer membrane protein assembly factor BamD [Phycisphaerae bacterium]